MTGRSVLKCTGDAEMSEERSECLQGDKNLVTKEDECAVVPIRP